MTIHNRSHPTNHLTPLQRLWLVSLLSLAGLGATSGDVRLVEAAKRGDIKIVRSLLLQRVDVNTPQADGTTALHWAVHSDDLEMARLLIRAGARVNSANQDYGVTPLSLACTNGSAPMIETLLEAGADANITVREGETPLMTAARTGKLEAVNVLLARTVDVNVKEIWNGQTALMWAIAEGHAPVAQALVDAGADIHARSNGGFTPLLFAVRKGSLDIVRLLLARGADVNQATPENATPLLVAVLNGHADLVDLLLDKGADPNVDGGPTDVTLPRTRVRVQPKKQVYRPLPKGAERRPAGNLWGTPLHAAVFMANPEGGDTHFTVSIDKVRVIKALLAHGADPNARKKTEEARMPQARYRADLTGATPFLLAAKAADVELMRLLLAHGADPKLATQNHTSPLMAAAGIAYCCAQDRATEREALEAVTVLVDLGADVNAVNDLNETPLHGAAYRGANTIVQFLLAKGAKIDVKDVKGRTPLTVADGVPYGGAFFAQPHTAALLREKGAKP